MVLRGGLSFIMHTGKEIFFISSDVYPNVSVIITVNVNIWASTSLRCGANFEEKSTFPSLVYEFATLFITLYLTGTWP